MTLTVQYNSLLTKHLHVLEITLYADIFLSARKYRVGYYTLFNQSLIQVEVELITHMDYNLSIHLIFIPLSLL